MKIPFDIKYRPQIESGEYKVETRSGKTARIICWNRVGIQLVVLVGKDEDVLTYNPYGTTGQQMPLPSDLFIITPEEELTPFEQEVSDIVEYCKEHGVNVASSYAKRHAKTLLNFAREQFIKDGYIIERKTFRDATEKADKEVIKEVSDNVDKTNELTEFESKLSWIISYAIINPTKSTPTNEYAKKSAKELLTLARKELVGEMLTSVPKESALYKAGVLDGKAEALKEIEQDPESSYAFKRGVEYGKEEILKDLPRWREWGGLWGDSYGLPIALVHDDRGFRLASVIGVGEKEFIMLDDLKKLPGFKED